MKKKQTHGFKGQYCTGCNTVWEVFKVSYQSGMEVKYPDFPSFGLEREQCSICKKSPKSFKDLPSRLAARERHKKLLHTKKHQELFTKHNKKQGN